MYEHGKDPQQVYNSELASHGFTPDEWSQELVMGKTPEGRAKIQAHYATSYQSLVSGSAEAKIDMSRSVAMEKLNAELDRRLALDDPQFASYLREKAKNSQEPDPT